MVTHIAIFLSSRIPRPILADAQVSGGRRDEEEKSETGASALVQRVIRPTSAGHPVAEYTSPPRQMRQFGGFHCLQSRLTVQASL